MQQACFWCSYEMPLLFTDSLHWEMCSQKVFELCKCEFTEGSTDSLYLLISKCRGKWITPRSHIRIQSGRLSLASHEPEACKCVCVEHVIYIFSSDRAVIFSCCSYIHFQSNVYASFSLIQVPVVNVMSERTGEPLNVTIRFTSSLNDCSVKQLCTFFPIMESKWVQLFVTRLFLTHIRVYLCEMKLFLTSLTLYRGTSMFFKFQFTQMDLYRFVTMRKWGIKSSPMIKYQTLYIAELRDLQGTNEGKNCKDQLSRASKNCISHNATW